MTAGTSPTSALAWVLRRGCGGDSRSRTVTLKPTLRCARPCFLDLVRSQASDPLTEVVLSALEVVVGALPVHPFALAARRGSKRVVGVGDGVVEAVGLDARGGLLPSAASARLVRESAQRHLEVGSRSLEHDV